MAKFKLKPWPFGNHDVKLHWFGNVRLDSNNNWRLRVAFENSNGIAFVDYPVGLLPVLRICQFYKHGKPLKTQQEGKIINIKINDLSQGKVFNSIDVARKFNYFLYGEVELIKQKIWSFKSSKSITCYIPQIELIRALYAKNKVLSNAMLRPGGIEYYIDNFKYENGVAKFDFSNEIASTVLTEDFVRHFAWIYLNLKIKQSFESIQTYAYAHNIKNTNNYGSPLKLELPELRGLKITCRGIEKNDEILILEVLKFEDFNIPADQIEYSHPSIKKRVYKGLPKKKKVLKSSDNNTYEIDKSSQSRMDTNQPLIEQEVTQISFQNNIKMKKVAKYEQQLNQGDKYVSRKGRGGTAVTKAGVDESIEGGKIQPIDFKTLEVTSDHSNYGLENFIKMINKLNSLHPELTVSMNFINLPLGRKFSWLPDGRRRICAIVRVTNGKGLSTYILEVALPDNRMLSTLIIPSTGNKEKDEEKINKLLKDLVFNSGSWKKDQLDMINHLRVKHTNKPVTAWAERIYNKIILYL